MKMPDGDKHPLYANRKEFQEKISILDAKVRASIEGKSIKEVTAYTKSAEGSIALFTLELLNRIGETGNNIDLENKHISWVLTNKEALEMFMTSGDLLNNNWRKAMEIFADIIEQDASAKSGLKLRLVVATALTFAYPVRSQAIWSNLIDGMKTYHQFVKWAEYKVFLSPFYEGTAWH